MGIIRKMVERRQQKREKKKARRAIVSNRDERAGMSMFPETSREGWKYRVKTNSRLTGLGYSSSVEPLVIEQIAEASRHRVRIQEVINKSRGKGKDSPWKLTGIGLSDKKSNRNPSSERDDWRRWYLESRISRGGGGKETRALQRWLRKPQAHRKAMEEWLKKHGRAEDWEKKRGQRK